MRIDDIKTLQPAAPPPPLPIRTGEVAEAHEGRLVVVNNALYLPGEAVIGQLKRLEESGYARLEAVIPVPEDITGYAETIRAEGPADPAPFNHATKISVVGISRKDKVGAR